MSSAIDFQPHFQFLVYNKSKTKENIVNFIFLKKLALFLKHLLLLSLQIVHQMHVGTDFHQAVFLYSNVSDCSNLEGLQQIQALPIKDLKCSRIAVTVGL